MKLTESYKNRLKELAGLSLISEATDAERNRAFAGSNKRIPYNKDLMIQAIKEGREVGILFQSDNDKYKMPVAKYRIIYPVAIGISKAGNQVIRAFHKFGQSESAARETGKRSAEAENAWRLMKVSNIKSMWMTGDFFWSAPEAYNRADRGMLNVEVAADFNKIRKFQENLVNQQKTAEKSAEMSQKIKKITPPEESKITKNITKPKTSLKSVGPKSSAKPIGTNPKQKLD